MKFERRIIGFISAIDKKTERHTGIHIELATKQVWNLENRGTIEVYYSKTEPFHTLKAAKAYIILKYS